jgi:hypothetical protein
MKSNTENTGIHSSWGARALNHVVHICTHYPGRGSATQSEAHTAEYVRDQLSQSNLSTVSLQQFQGLRSIWLFLALVFGIAMVGHAAFWLLRSPAGEVPALLISVLAFAFSFYLLWRKFTFRTYPLRSTLPHAASQNVIAVIPPEDNPGDSGPPPRQVVLIAHLDSHRAVWLYSTDLLVKVYAVISPVAIFGLLLAPLTYALGVLTGLDQLFWLAVPLAMLHFLSWFTGVTADLGLFSPGANDNASSIGVLLTLAQRLKEQPMLNAQVWLAFTGCEETGCDGILNFLAEYGEQLKDALFLDLEMVGIGSHLAYIRSEGVIHKTHIPEPVENMLLKTGDEFGIKPLDTGSFGAFTEMGAIWENGLRGACLLLQPENFPSMPEWHRLTDLPDRLQPEALEMAHNFIWKLLGEIDAGSSEAK